MQTATHPRSTAAPPPEQEHTLEEMLELIRSAKPIPAKKQLKLVREAIFSAPSEADRLGPALGMLSVLNKILITVEPEMGVRWLFLAKELINQDAAEGVQP